MNTSEIDVPKTTNIVDIKLVDKGGNVVMEHSQHNHYSHKAWEYFFNDKYYGWGGDGGIVSVTNRPTGSVGDILYEPLWISGGPTSELNFMTTSVPSPNTSTDDGGSITSTIGYEYGGHTYIKNTKEYYFQHGGIDMTITCLGLGSPTTCHSYVIMDTPVVVTREHRLVVTYNTLFRDDSAIALTGGNVTYTDGNRIKIGEGILELGGTDHTFSVHCKKYRTHSNSIVTASHNLRDNHSSGNYGGMTIDTSDNSVNLSGEYSLQPVVITPNKRNYTFVIRYAIPPTHPAMTNVKTILFNYPSGDNQFELVFDTPITTQGDVQISFDIGMTLVANQET